ncbi:MULTISPECIES: hypothetical protein [Paenibacillus]|uniref:Uncharacterized protein n=1 Tax=Paenibacillus lautus TaxID=1401 RepID=A0A1R1AU79_PAELA|nr:hypothetical protein [Paenibacillus lautus]OME89123.1 hypothetical protein BK123_27515 [Paenibacillus lautus]
MNHLTSIDECRDSKDRLLKIQESSIHSKSMIKMQHFVQIYMNSAARLMHPISAHVCILFSDRALGCMLKALYMKENNCIFSPSYFSLQDVIQLTGQNSIPDLDKVMFIHTLNFVVGCNDVSIFQQMDASQLQKLLNRVDDVLIHLSGRVASNPSELYRSIF